jgi:propionate CoA-transferase
VSKICDAATAVAAIRDKQTVASTGVLGWLTPDAVLRAVRQRFDATGSPADLTFYFPCGTGDAIEIPGMDHVAKKGLMRRVVSGSYINPRNPRTGERPALMELIQSDLIEAYSWPIGASMHWLREVARKSPGYLTEIGLGTYIDPRHGGGRFTSQARDDLVELVEFRGKEYLFYPTWPLDVGVIRASSADDAGNLSFEDQPVTSSAIALALAVKASGGTVIAQVARIVPRGSRPAHAVQIPGNLVDHIVVAADAMIGTDVRNDPGYLGPVPNAVEKLPRLPDGASKIVARRVAQEIRPGEPSIFGFGASSDAVLALAEGGALDADRLNNYVFTTEHGSFGGVVMSGWQFSANYSPEALLDGLYQFDFIDGGGCAFAALAFAQLDAAGNVNVSRFGTANPGAGGFIDIAHNAKRLVFAGTLTTGALDVDHSGGRLRIRREGNVCKLVRQADEITYRIREGVRDRGQEALVITERAVFQFTPDGLLLTEVAPGIDIRRDVLDRIEFDVSVSDRVSTWDASLLSS